MGARQRAQKRGKALKGSQKGSPASQKKLNSSMHVSDLSSATRRDALLGWQDFSLSSSPSDRKAFTMGDTARNTERHTFGWGSSKLRDQGISFVSAGTLHQDPEHTRAHDEDVQIDEQPKSDSPDQKLEDVIIARTDSPSPQPEIQVTPATEHKNTQNYTEGVANSTTFRSRSRQSSTSSSESEQIVFTGRSKVVTPNVASNNASKKPSRTQSLTRSLPKPAESNGKKTSHEEPTTQPIPILTKPPAKLVFEASSSDRRPTNSRLRRRGRHGRRQNDIDEQEAIMRDYIANMAMDDTEESEAQIPSQPIQQLPRLPKSRKNETFRYYGGSGEENMKVQIQSTRKKIQDKDLDQALDWNSDELKDFDDLETTDDEVDEVSQVIRHRHRESGPQYLVIPIGLGASDAKWILHEKLVSESARVEVAVFEEIQAMEFEEESLDEDDDDDDDDDEDGDETTDSEMEEALNDLVDHIESEDDENARIMKHAARMTDEQIARALAKQEELGMGGDELILLTGDIGEDDDEQQDINDAFGRNDDFISFSLGKHTSNRTRSRKNRKNRDSFPSAAAFADALDQDPYGAFDVMDFDRPSLKAKKKGRKSDFLYDLQLEDEDLRNQLISTWTKDRDKKAQRKLEKEEARQVALLEHADRSEPRVIKAEIRQFLLQEVDTLRLSPMESNVRAAVHRLAKALKLNSRSEGKEGIGLGRYPVLTKTIKTPSYTIDSIWEIDSLLNTRKFFPKTLGSYKKDKLPRGTARSMRMRQSGGVQGASYMNGEIVGASAPELGADNRGRAMLEKMGWSSGMAIGAEGNKGSLEAVKHVFKTSRAGLG